MSEGVSMINATPIGSAGARQRNVTQAEMLYAQVFGEWGKPSTVEHGVTPYVRLMEINPIFSEVQQENG